MEEEVGKFPQAVAEIYNSLLAISLFLPTSLPFSVCVVAIDRLPNFFSLSCLRIPLFIMIRYIDCRGVHFLLLLLHHTAASISIWHLFIFFCSLACCWRICQKLPPRSPDKNTATPSAPLLIHAPDGANILFFRFLFLSTLFFSPVSWARRQREQGPVTHTATNERQRRRL